MTLSPGLRKLVLTVHVTSSVGLLGAIAAFLALAVVGLTNQSIPIVRAAYPAMEVIAWYIIVPLAFASLLLGTAQALGTPWGLFRHWWVLIKLLVTVFAIIVLLLQMQVISYVGSAAAEATFSNADLIQERMSLVIHAGGGLMVLLIPMVLSVYKPRGLTRYGARKQRQQRTSSQPTQAHAQPRPANSALVASQ